VGPGTALERRSRGGSGQRRKASGRPGPVVNSWRWAPSLLAEGCTTDDTSDSNYQAATGPDNRATTHKKAVVGLRDLVPVKYGLTTYQWSQL
jgi:hypothetical protein